MKRILIDASADVLRIAYAVDGELEDFVAERRGSRSCIGNIYAARVQSVVKGQFAFVDIGLKAMAFLPLDQNLSAQANPIKSGQAVLVQVQKDPVGSKGATVSTDISMGGRLAVVASGTRDSIDGGSVGISRRIADEAERARLKEIAVGVLSTSRENSTYNVIIRTEAASVDAKEIENEIRTLTERLTDLLSTGAYIKPPALLHPKTGQRLLRDLPLREAEDIAVNDIGLLDEVRDEAESLCAGSGAKVRLYEGDSIFGEYYLTKRVDELLSKRVWLSCGGYIVIERTEACVIIDVNTGKHMDRDRFTDAVFKTNMQAATKIAEQIRLRNLSGMIIVDFINMSDEQRVTKLRTAFEAELKKDRVPAFIIGMTELGLMQLTRKKTREPIGDILQRPCERCGGTGRV